MTKTKSYVLEDQDLPQAIALMDQLHLEQMPVLQDHQSGRWLGVINRKKIIASARKRILNPAA